MPFLYHPSSSSFVLLDKDIQGDRRTKLGTAFMEGLVQCSANYVPLSPISFLERAAVVYGDKDSIIYGTVSYTWRQTLQRCINLASALSCLGIFPGDVVAALAPNVPALYELHFGVPMAGAILSALNPRLDSTTLALILQQLEAKIIFVDPQFLQLTLQAFHILSNAKINPPILVLISDSSPPATSSNCTGKPPAGSLDYNGVLAMGQPDFEIIRPSDEFTPISVNYTSGSTGNPKGVVYSHRAAYLNSLAVIFRYDLKQTPVFLWTVDMFRCNGWCFPWTMAALGGTNICLRKVSAEVIYYSVFHHNVTHLCGATSLLNLIAEAELPDRQPLRRKVDMVVAGALPAPHIVLKVLELGFKVKHSYGMTEALGPVIAREWQSELKSGQGIQDLIMEEVDVKDPSTMKSVPRDGKTIGEVMLRGNTMMMGYYKNLKATRESFKGGWYRTGDLAVMHCDGCIQMKDRSNDVIVSGMETISSIEIEAVMARHPVVSEVAVVGRPYDDCLGETPCAFVKLKEGYSESAEEIAGFCTELLPACMIPRTVIFGDLPVNSTGKIQKFVLREKAKALGQLSP